jgi:hypothetical protein
VEKGTKTDIVQADYFGYFCIQTSVFIKSWEVHY